MKRAFFAVFALLCFMLAFIFMGNSLEQQIADALKVALKDEALKIYVNA